MRKHPTFLFFWALVIALGLWASAAALVGDASPWRAGPGMMGRGALLDGAGAWRPMHMWGGGPYILSQTGGPPQIADVERALSEWIALEGNPRLKPGPVTEKDANAFQADVVTKDGSLAQRFIIDRRTGRLAPSED